MNKNAAIATCALAIILALVVGVGFASHTFVHHIVQTLPLWVVVAFRRRPIAVWFGFTSFLFWLLIMVAIWLFLLHLATFVRGHFSTVEIAMTLIVGAASAAGIVLATKIRARAPALLGGLLLGAAAQYACFRLSKIPAIWYR